VKDRYEQRVEKMLAYADSETHCRSVFLLGYFGEVADRCGNCDVCRERNELDLSKYEFDLIIDEIKKVLVSNNPDAEELVKMILHPEEKVIKVIRWLLDHKRISSDKDYRLKWESE